LQFFSSVSLQTDDWMIACLLATQSGMMYIERLQDVMIVSITLHYIDRSELQYNIDLLIGFVRMIYTETWIPAHLKPQREKHS
jgi:hypothetical protein